MPSLNSSQIFLNKLALTLNSLQVNQPFSLDKLDPLARIFLIGNGGSAAVAAHIANDLVKGGHSAFSLSEPAVLTCLSNDLGYEHCYQQQLRSHFRMGDCLIAISSSGRSPNILNAINQIYEMTDFVVTLSGFDEDNPLRQMGDYNYYVHSANYGIVEIAHLAILHAIVRPE